MKGEKDSRTGSLGLAREEKDFDLDKLDMQLSLSSGYVWNEMRGGRGLTRHTQS